MILFPIAFVWMIVLLVYLIRNSKNEPEAPEGDPPPQAVQAAAAAPWAARQRFSISSANAGSRFATARLNSASYCSSIPSSSVRM